MEESAPKPPRNGEGDQPQAGGGGYATSRKTIELARQERRSGNLPEVVLWRALRSRPGGLKFRRQHPIGPYVLDFACLSARLAIEVDGAIHAHGDRARRDMVRDARLESVGFRTLRVRAADVLSDLDSVVRGVVAACETGKPLHRPADGPPPRSGEVFLDEQL
jgi:very-short-patch-repair endonuclease